MFYSDKPILSTEEDLFHRNNFAKNFAQTILRLRKKETFTVGLFGKWGSGKTSLVNMILREIKESKDFAEEEKPIIVRFDPWNFAGTDDLLIQFFVRLSNIFMKEKDKKLNKIGKEIRGYAKVFSLAELIPAYGPLISLVGKLGMEKIAQKLTKGIEGKDILKQKEEIIQLLESQSRKVLIVIDDIDRLGQEQIRQIFRLVASVAQFPNTMYLLVFDKEVVVRALEEVQKGKGEEYLEKIIQMPIEVPEIQKEDLRKELEERFEKILEESKKVIFSEEHWQNLYMTCIDPLIRTMRDVNRLTNAVEFKLSAISSEVEFTDMVGISILEIQLPSIYEWVKKNKELLTKEEIRFGREKKSQKEWKDYYQDIFRKLLQKEKGDVEDKGMIENVTIFLSRLFPKFANKIGVISYETYDSSQHRRNNQIAHPDKFERYFHLNVDQVEIKRAEILDALYVAEAGQLKEILLDKEGKGSSYELYEEIMSRKEEVSEERAKVIIEAFFQSANKLTSSKFALFPARVYMPYGIISLFEKISSDKRSLFLSDLIVKATSEQLQTYVEVIRDIEKSYGRFCEDGQEREEIQIITLEELICIERAFCHRIKEILKEISLFDIVGCYRLWSFLKDIDKDYIDEYLKEALKEDEKLLKYLKISVNIWDAGRSSSYEIKEAYKEYLTEDLILQAIERQKEKGSFFELPLQTQEIAGAFYLNICGETRAGEHVSQKKIHTLLDSWKK